MAFSFGGGAGAAAPTTGFSFGGGSTTAPAASTGFSFGAAAPASSTSTGFALGASAPAFGAATSATPAFGATAPAFGAATSAVPAFGAATSAAPAFGAASSAAPAFGAATSAAPAFGAATSAAPAFGAATAAAPAFGAATSTGLGLGGPAASTGFSLNFGGTTASTVGGFGTAVSTATPGLGGFGTTADSSGPAVLGLGGNTTAPNFGLGGQPTQTNQVSTECRMENKNIKDACIPGELSSTVEDLKKQIKEDKTVGSDISHFSDKQYRKIQEETDALFQLVTVLATGIHKNRLSLEKLKLSSAQELLNVEIAQRTKETPASMQYENVAPMNYFVNLVQRFETEMSEYRKQIDQTQQHIRLLGSAGGITSADIVQAVQRLHAVFTELATKYQGIHQNLATCKEQYVTVHRRIHGSSVSAFERKSALALKVEPAPARLNGPSPFSAPTDPLIQARAVLPNKSQQNINAGMGPPTLGLNLSSTPSGAFGSFNANQTFGAAGTGFGANTSGFGANTSGFGANTSGFGGSTLGFGGNTSAFGRNTSGFGGGTTGFGSGSTGGFGGSTSILGVNTSGFGSPANTAGFGNTSGFGSPSLTTSPTSPPVGSKRNKI